MFAIEQGLNGGSYNKKGERFGLPVLPPPPQTLETSTGSGLFAPLDSGLVETLR